MKNIKSIYTIIVLLTLGFATSCSTPDATPTPTPPVTLSNDYWPTAVNNVWNYIGGTQLEQIKIGSFNSNYYIFNNFFGTSSAGSGLTVSSTASLKKDSGNYYLKYGTFQLGGSYVGTMNGFEIIILKDNLPVGGTWNSTYSQTANYTSPIVVSATTTTSIAATILEKDVSLMVNTTTYTNVIHVKIIQTNSSASGIVIVENHYWFSKNIGLIKYSNINGTQTSTNLLNTYTLF
jgi:hypothetical protein